MGYLGWGGGVSEYFDSEARDTVVRVLSTAETKNISVATDAVTVSSAAIGGVRYAVSRNLLNVRYSSALDGWAEYDAEENVLALGFCYAESVTREALIVHECIHAAVDLSKVQGLMEADNEGAAYIGQCMYAQQKMTTPGARLYSENAARDLVFERAWDIADKLLQGTSVTPYEYQRLRTAIHGHPWYPNSRDVHNYDGI